MKIYFIEPDKGAVRVSTYANSIPRVGDEIMVESNGNPLKSNIKDYEMIYGVVKEVRWSYLLNEKEIIKPRVDINKWSMKFVSWFANKTTGVDLRNDLELEFERNEETQFVYIIFEKINLSEA